MNPNPIPPDDPRITAYALGDLQGAERAEFESQLQADPVAQAAVGEVRAMAARLTAALALEATQGMEELAPESDDSRDSDLGHAKGRPFVWTLATAAGIAACLAFLVSRNRPQPAPVASPVARSQVSELALKHILTPAPKALADFTQAAGLASAKPQAPAAGRAVFGAINQVALGARVQGASAANIHGAPADESAKFNLQLASVEKQPTSTVQLEAFAAAPLVIADSASIEKRMSPDKAPIPPLASSLQGASRVTLFFGKPRPAAASAAPAAFGAPAAPASLAVSGAPVTSGAPGGSVAPGVNFEYEAESTVLDAATAEKIAQIFRNEAFFPATQVGGSALQPGGFQPDYRIVWHFEKDGQVNDRELLICLGCHEWRLIDGPSVSSGRLSDANCAALRAILPNKNPSPPNPPSVP